MLDYKEQNYGFDTLMIHAGTQADPVTHAVNLPVYQATAYTFESTEYAKNLFVVMVISKQCKKCFVFSKEW